MGGALAAVVLLAASGALAQVADDPLTPTERELADRAPIRIAVQVEPPAGVLEDGRVAGGWATELVELAVLKVGADVELVAAHSASDALALLANGSVDLIGPFAGRPDLASFTPTSPFAWTRTMFVTHDGHDDLLTTDQLAGLRVGTIPGSRSESWLLANRPDVVNVPMANVSEGISRLAARDLDAFLGPLGLIGYQMQQTGHRNVRPLGEPVEVTTIHFWSQPGSPSLAILEKGRQRITDEELGLIHVKWTGFDLGPPRGDPAFIVPLWVQLAAGGFAALALLLAAGTVILRRQVAARTEALQRERAFLATVLDTDPNPVWVKDIKSRYVIANRAWARLVDRPLAELPGRTDEELGIQPQDAGDVAAEEAQALGSSTPLLVPERALRDPKTGQERWFSITLVAVRSGERSSTDLLGVWVDVTQERRLRIGLEDEVAQRTAELHRTIEDLEAFARMAGHDLRAPLHTIDGHAYLLLDDDGAVLGAEGREHAQGIQKAVRRMVGLLDAILQLSRGAAARPEMIVVDISALANDLRREIEGRDPQRKVRWEIQPGLRATGDPKLLSIVLTNLLGNAWKYSSKQREAVISFTGKHERGRMVFEVRDNGAGFDPAAVTNLWQPFQRLHDEKDFPGSGIGLATVKRIIARHGGDVAAEGKPGQGAVFRFELPAPPTEGVAKGAGRIGGS